MFDHAEAVLGLLPGERPQDLQSKEDLAYLMTQLELADGWVDDERQLLPDVLDDLPPAHYSL